jgi:hypothetical protein
MTVRLRDLNTVEWHTLNRLARGVPHLKFDDEALASLLELGLAERKPGGFGLSASGQHLLNPLRAKSGQR